MDRPKLTAQKLKRCYHQGERHFENVNLSGESLRGMNLTGINISESNLSNADLRGANFTDAKLINTCLSEAKTGTRRRWSIPKLLLTLLFAIVPSFLSFFFWALFALLIYKPGSTGNGNATVSLVLGGAGLVLMTFFLILIYRRGIQAVLGNSLIFIAIAVPFTITICILFIVATGSNSWLNIGPALSFITVTAVVLLIATFSVALASTFAGAFVFACAGAIASNITFVFVFIAAFAWAVAVVALVLINSQSVFHAEDLIVFAAIVGSFFTLVVSYLISSRALKGDPRDRLVRNVAVWFAALGATKFKRANLTGADFSKATLKGAHFHGAILTHTRFHLAQKLNLARLDKTILADFAVQDLLVTLRGRGKSYTNCNLKGVNLLEADLADADLTEADLSQANLEGAELQRVNFTKTQVLSTKFLQANLTGACIEAWNIDSTTQLTGAICEYVYLLNNQQERRPSSGKFQSGEFTKLFEEVLDTIDLIFQNGIDWKAFVRAFDKVRVDNNGTELTIQSIQNKGDGVVVVRVDVPPNTDKEKIHSEFAQTYDQIRQELEAQYKQKLDAKDREIIIYEQQSVQMWSVINRLAERPPISTTENILGDKIVNDQSQSFRVKGDFNITAQNSIVNLRDISGEVSNQISQLPNDSSSDQPSLKDLLTQIKAAVEADTELSEEEKIDALVEVGELTKAAKAPQEDTMQKMAKRAMNALKGIASNLSDVSKLTSACKELLPLIMTIFGLA